MAGYFASDLVLAIDDVCGRSFPHRALSERLASEGVLPMFGFSSRVRYLAGLEVEASTGTISFNQLGEVEKNVQVQVVEDGAFHRHSVVSDPELLAPPER